MSFHEGNITQDNIDVTLDPAIVVSSPLTRLKAKQAARGEIESVVCEERCYTAKYLKEFSNSFKHKSVGMDFKGVATSKRDIKVDQAELIVMCPQWKF